MTNSTLPRTAGIYLITNTANGFVYVGSARNIRYRWSNHLTYLRKRKHHNPILQRAFDKYGEAVFTIAVLELVSDERELVSTEQRWLDELDVARRRDAYNVLAVAYSNIRPAKPCANCKRLKKPLRAGRCHACAMFFRRTGRERPYVESARAEQRAATAQRVCLRCRRSVLVAGYAAKGLCKSCYRAKYRAEV